MTDHEAFLFAIIERPQDDLLRLVFADFLEESGEVDRAEFIRLQIELARLEPDSPDWTPQKLRCEELLREHDWRIPGLRGKQEFRRGFVEVIGTTGRLEIVIPFNAPPDTPTALLIVSGSAWVRITQAIGEIRRFSMFTASGTCACGMNIIGPGSLSRPPFRVSPTMPMI